MKYFEIFTTGKHTSSNGVSKEWTESDLDKIVNNFNEKKLSVPIVIGHPKTNSPAYGWIEDVKREGPKLLAKPKQVVEEFKEWVNKGLYKNRSISLYPDLTLRHVGFLGATAPAVKGLEEFQFEESAEFEEYTLEAVQLSNVTGTSQNAEFDRLKEENQNFNEQLTSKDAKIKELEEKLDAQEKEKRTMEYEQFASELIDGGNITPAQKSFVVDFMEICNSNNEYEFSEGSDKNVLNRFKDFLKGLKQIEFSEIANAENLDSRQKNEILDFSDSHAIADAISTKREAYLAQGKRVSESAILAEIKRQQA